MYHEYRYVRVEGNAKLVMLVIGAVLAPLSLLLLPAGELSGGDLIAWVLISGMFGALAGTIVGYGVDSVSRRLRRRPG